jgi:transcriptional regulator with XRE-family HTH domain
VSFLTLDNSFGGQLKKLRIKHEIGLREFARKIAHNNYAKLESGDLHPPKSKGEVLALIALFPMELKKSDIEGLILAAYAHHRNRFELLFETGEGIK